MRRPHLILPLGCLLLPLATAQPAAAEQSAVSSASVTLEAGGLSISAPLDAGNLGTKSNGVGAVTISGPLGTVTVTDSRGAPEGSGWVASAISTAFDSPGPPAASIGAGFVGYTAGTIGKTGTATYTANDPATLSGVSPVVTATAITGDNTASWNPTIKVSVAADMPAGVYIGTITHSVL